MSHEEGSAHSGDDRSQRSEDRVNEDDTEWEDEEEEEEEEDGDPDGGQTSKVFEITDQVFEDLELGEHQSTAVQSTWHTYLREAASREVAGEAIYTAVFEAAPSLQSLFKTPRAVLAMRFMNGLNNIVAAAHDPKSLRVVVETLGFQHLDLEVTIPRIVIFREAIVDLLQVELGPRMTSDARDGWTSLLNYVGGAYIYIRIKYTDRLKILASSWAEANNKTLELEESANEDQAKNDGAEETSGDATVATDAGNGDDDDLKQKNKGKWNSEEPVADNGGEADNSKGISVPRTFNDMFSFNAAVMGFGSSVWMQEVLASFDTIVSNVSNSYRLQEECDVLALRIARFKGVINLGEFKAVMLASLRSLVPQNWNSAHEVAWGWLWENVERLLKSLMGKPAERRRALEKFFVGLDDNQQEYIRKEVYTQFFLIAPAGQDYFKQSTTRLHFIADRIMSMTLEIYKEPKRLVEDISALGLRHVGYGIPTELFGPFVTALVQVVRGLTDNELAEEGFRWSASLISRILVRVINEGSTIVMRAINVNSAKQLQRAVACAPRGKREGWMLNVQVGTQSISPLLWAIETGSLEAARAIIEDLLTIRADRDRYYFGVDGLFKRHPDIIKRLCADAPALLPILLDRLIWRSRVAERGLRRVNYYVKHLIVSDEGGFFAPTLEWLVEDNDPKVICHPVVALVTDTVWGRVAARVFFVRKIWLVFTLLVFVYTQSIVKYFHEDRKLTLGENVSNFISRTFVYVFSMGWMFFGHVRDAAKDFRAGRMHKWGYLYYPEYLTDWQNKCTLLLSFVLLLMACTEPIFYCFSHQGTDKDDQEDLLFTQSCVESKSVRGTYSVLSMLAICLYYLLLVDLSVFSNHISAFVLICGRVLSEVCLFLTALLFTIVTFSCAISSLEHESSGFDGVTVAARSLLEITVGLFDTSKHQELVEDPPLFIAVYSYVLCSVVFLLNMLIAQLNCSYQSTFQDMLGYARLNRGKVVVDSMASVSKARWARFVTSLRLDERLTFNEGDIGFAGGIQVLEPASLNPTTEDTIQRFGGSTSPNMQWPEDRSSNLDEDRLDRMERLLKSAIKKLGLGKGGKKDNSMSSLEPWSSSHSAKGSQAGSELDD